MRRKRKRRGAEEVELNLAAMLDMAFQLLAFFILTFRPSPVEGQLVLRMPPPQPVTQAQKAALKPRTDVLVQSFNTLIITVLADAQGDLAQLTVGENSLKTVDALDRLLAEVIGDTGFGFDQVLVQVDSRLHYDWLMRVIDVCTRQKLPNGERLSKLSFVELPASPSP